MALRRELMPLVAASNLVSLGVIAFLLLTGAAGKGAARFTEVTAERVNIVGQGDRPVLILANRRLMPGPRMNGKEYPRELSEGRELLSGMIFLNEDGDEVGGLLFNGFKKGAGPADYGALGHLSFDQWKQNQVIVLQYNDHGTSRRAGLMIFDRPQSPPMDVQLERGVRMLHASATEREELARQQREAAARGENGAQRVFVGSQDSVAQVQLMDKRGRVRARLSVDADDAPHLDFLDEAGTVISTYPPRPQP